MLSDIPLILLVGLGNPGPHYKNNRHNIGFMAIDRIAAHYRFPPFKIKDKVLLSEGKIGKKKIILVKPMDFMNRSGQALAPLARFYKVLPEGVIILHDDLDLAPGKVRIKQGGGAGGHNGLKDIDAHFGKETWRIRLGIGHPGHREGVTAHVLNDFTKQEQEWVDLLLTVVADEVLLMITDDKERFMTNVAHFMQKI